MKREILVGTLLGLACFAGRSWGQWSPPAWNPQAVLRLNGEAGAVKLPGEFKIVTENLSRSVTVPYIVYMPEKDRLLMLVSCDYPYHAMVLFSNDHGATWHEPKFVHLDPAGDPEVLEAHSLTYLGGGKVLLSSGKKNTKNSYIWFSTDYGETWGDPVPTPKNIGFGFWDPFFVDRNPKTGQVERILASGYGGDPHMGVTMKAGYQDAGLTVSTDEGHTWSDFSRVPQWTGVSEVAFVRAANGNLVAACRTDWLDRFRKQDRDHYEGLAISISRDNGKTWSEPKPRLYAWGRHHPSMVLLPNGDIVMSYVVRKGYPDTPEGIPQFGVEAIVSHDNGESWDLDHRYILARWSGLTKGPNKWLASPQATSTVLMPDGSLLTAFGTGYRSLDPSRKILPAPRDAGLVSWRVSQEPVDNDRRITDAPWDSDLRNEYNPDPARHEVRSECGAAPGKKILSVPQDGAQVSTSAGDGRPEYLLHDSYTQPVLTLESLPAWVEIRWPKEHRIDEIHILPGAPAWAERPGTEEVPLDYRLQYEKGGQWQDLVTPVANAERFRAFNPTDKRPYIFSDVEFEYIHKFPVVETKAIRMKITRSSDTGIREAGGQVVAPEDQRETALRSIEVFEAK